MNEPARATLAWLLGSKEPAIRLLARRELFDDRALVLMRVVAALGGNARPGGAHRR